MFSVDIFRKQVARGPVQATGLTSAFKVVSLMNLRPVLLLAGHKSSAVHVQDLFSLPDQPGGKCKDILPLLHSGIVGITRMIDQGKRGINGYAYFYNLIAGPFIIRL